MKPSFMLLFMYWLSSQVYYMAVRSQLPEMLVSSANCRVKQPALAPVAGTHPI